MMFKCPVCGNTEEFMCDVVGVAKYNQNEDAIGAVDAVDFNFKNGYCCCLKCTHQAAFEYFEEE